MVAIEIPAATDGIVKNHNEPSSVTPPTIEEHVEEVKKDTTITAAAEVERHEEKFIVHHIA